MNDGPTISVVVPTYQRADSLRRLLSAIDAQEGARPLEVIVVDDGSTDGTSYVTSAYPAVRYIRQSNAGPATARNRGWRAAKGEVVAFLDDDTVPTRHWLVQIATAFRSDPDLGALGGGIAPLAPGFLADFAHLEQHVSHGVDADGEVKYLVTANAAWRRNALESLGGFDEGFRRASGEDTDLTLRAASAGIRIKITDDAVVHHDDRTSLRAVLATYRRHGASRHRVVRANPSPSWRRRVRRNAGPAHWVGRYRRYRAHGCSALTAAGYLAVRALGLAAYLTGMAVDQIERRNSS